MKGQASRPALAVQVETHLRFHHFAEKILDAHGVEFGLQVAIALQEQARAISRHVGHLSIGELIESHVSFENLAELFGVYCDFVGNRRQLEGSAAQRRKSGMEDMAPDVADILSASSQS